MSITPFSTHPSRAMTATEFSRAADTFFSELPRFVTEANAQAASVNADKTASAASASASAESASSASVSAVQAAESATLAAAAANYKGEWAAQSYAAPAAVMYGGIIWLAGQATLATDVPGTSTKWARLRYVPIDTETIGIPGTLGFGVGVCPPEFLPDGFSALYGHNDPTHANYGNYQFSDGSIMVWVPKFFYRINYAGNPTHAANTPNDIHVVGTETFPTEASANLAGYALHRAFVDGGVEKPGFFVDKYVCSKNARGTGFVASSIANAAPITFLADHNPITDLTACPTMAFWSALDAAKARDGVNGAKNPNSRFFCNSRFIWGALAMLSLAHGQAATSTGSCAWYDGSGTTNYPKGCNNNALRDVDDSSVLYAPDGYQNCGRTGSGAPFAKTTHNGQACGVCDMNGLIWEINIGLTCVAASTAITGATPANPCVLTVVGHGRTTGDIVVVAGVGGMTQLNNNLFTVTVVDADHISLDGVDATGYTEYASGGTITTGTFHAAKRATAMKDFTPGTTLATDHWGATGVAAMLEPVPLPLRAASGGTAALLRFGNGATRVLSSDASGDGHTLAGLCAPQNNGAVSTAGTPLFGSDQYYQYIRNELCAVSGGNWNTGGPAGVCALTLVYSRIGASGIVGFRCACFPD